MTRKINKKTVSFNAKQSYWKNQGCVNYKKDNYYAVVTYYENGERKVKWISLHLKTSALKKTVKARLQEIEDFYEGLFNVSEETLFIKYLSGWVERRRGLVENSTWKGIWIYFES